MELAPQSLRGCSLEEVMWPMSWAGIRAPSLPEKWEVRWGQLEGPGGWEGACHLSGLAELPAPICRGAARPP